MRGFVEGYANYSLQRDCEYRLSGTLPFLSYSALLRSIEAGLFDSSYSRQTMEAPQVYMCSGPYMSCRRRLFTVCVARFVLALTDLVSVAIEAGRDSDRV